MTSGSSRCPLRTPPTPRLTIWLPNAFYIPKTTEGAKLEAAKKFIAFANSPEGCEIQATVGSVSGPFAISSCKLPDDVPALVKDDGALPRRRQVGPGAGVRVADQGSEPGADHRRGGLRHPRRPRRAPSSTTRTLRSRPSSLAFLAGEADVGGQGRLASILTTSGDGRFGRPCANNPVSALTA